MKRVMLTVSGLFVLVVGVTAVGLRRVGSSLDDDKAKLLELVEEHAACLSHEDVACLRTTSSWDEQALERELAHSRSVRAQLGARGKAEPIKSSWSLRKFNSLTSGATIMTRVSLATVYERDSQAWERVEVVEHKGKLRVRSMRVHSEKLAP
jgi:hypothetical protein